MFRIRKITDDALPINAREIEQVQAMLRERLPGVQEAEIAGIPERLRDPLESRFHSMLLVADDLRGHVRGFALIAFAPDVNFVLLEYIVASARMTASGVGGALYQRVRDVSRDLGAEGLFFECLPDDPAACSDPALAQSNAARLRFYERYGARPIVGTEYERPLKPGQKDLPHLVYDDLGTGRPLRRDHLRRVVEAILTRKYAELCPPEYVRAVLDSIREDPVRLREPRYSKAKRATGEAAVERGPVTGDRLITLVVNDKHDIHHVRERGYVESPVRIKSILDGIEPTGLFWRTEPQEYPERHIREVHDGKLVDYLKTVSGQLKDPRTSIYPYVFPIRNKSEPPRDLMYGAGYYCIDTFTPIHQNVFKAAKRAVDCTLTAADAILAGQRFAYALVRPPGHHAEYRVFGGFCYFCNCAVAANYLSRHGRVAILDIDYHHGNGQEDIFYSRSDVLTVSIHGHPRIAYPFFSGGEEEIGAGEGRGYNLNIPLGETVDGAAYLKALRKAMSRIREFGPAFLVVSLGLDTAKNDPTGNWSLVPDDFETNGREIAALNLPTLVVQEGGYRTTTLGTSARRFFLGLAGDYARTRASGGAAGSNGRATAPSRSEGRTEPGSRRPRAAPGA